MEQLSIQNQKAALRRALMRVKPEYFSWSLADQEKYRVSMPEDDNFRIRQTILRSLFRIKVRTPKDINAALALFETWQYTLLNSALQPVRGIGEDYFCLQESLGEKTLLHFSTLYDYDYWDHCFQEEARSLESPQYATRPYRGSLHLTWARLYIDGTFYYATLSMAAMYILSAIRDAGENLIREIIPFRYVEGKEHGKRERKGTVFDLRIDAAGQEGQLKELQDRFERYLSDRGESLQEQFDHAATKAVHFIDRSTTDENHIHIIFTDRKVLETIRLRYFIQDCRSISEATKITDFYRIVEQEKEAVATFVKHSYEDIFQTYDSKVVRLRKKQKVIIYDGEV